MTPGRFNALFGRDSLITSLQLLEVRPDVARSTLRALAALQGRDDDPLTDEEPGKIVHEYRPEPDARFEASDWSPLIRDGQLRYYGSADSTPWFLVVLASLGDAALAGELEDSWRAAGGWLERALERGGGLVRYGPRTVPGGLVHQGWRDTVDPLDPSGHGGGILHEDGTAPEPADRGRRHPGRGACGTARAGGAAGRWRDGRSREGAGRADRAALRTGDDGRRGRRSRGEGRGLAAGLAAVGGCALTARGGAGGRPPVPSRTCSRPSGCARSPSSTRSSPRPPTTAGRSGRSTRGSAGAACAPPAARRQAERVRSGVLDALERLGLAPELYAVTDEGPERVPIANQVQAWTVGRPLGAREPLGRQAATGRA